MANSIEVMKATLSKTEAIEKLAKLRSSLAKARVKEKAEFALRTVIGSTLAAAGGGVAGFLAVKAPFIPRTKIRSDLAVGTGAALVAAAGEMFLGVEVSTGLGDIAKGLIGSGTSRHVEDFLRKPRV